jgi:uncharacterized protein YbjT (DUF2867 family)
MISRTVGLMAAVAAFAWGAASAQAAEILAFGGNRATGLEAVKELVAKKDKVTVFVRPESEVAELKTLGVTLVTGDVMKPDDVKKAFTAAKFTAVVSALGGTRKDTERPDFEGVKNMVDAAKAAGVKRIVVVTAIGVGDSNVLRPEAVNKVLGATFVLKGKAEDYLVASGLDYTVIRPGALKTGPATGKAYLTEDHKASSNIQRADLGKLAADCLGDKKTFKKILHAIDPTMPAEVSFK